MATVFLVILLVHLGAAYDAPSWRWDYRTNKEYAVLTSRRLMDFETSRALCDVVGGHLPEPRSLRENQFVSLLSDSRILLGMRDLNWEGEWKWDSDATMNVSWFNWQNWQSEPNMRPEPNGYRRENCALILKNAYNGSSTYHDRDTWGDTRCDHDVYRIVCEKSRKCLMKIRKCYFDQGLLNINAPKVSHLCAVKDHIESCIDRTRCNDRRVHRAVSQLFKRLNTEFCALTVNWVFWERTATKTCKNDAYKEVDTMKKRNECAVRYHSSRLNFCGKANQYYACWVNEVSAACAPAGIFRDDMKELMRARVRAYNATLLSYFTRPPHNCRINLP